MVDINLIDHSVCDNIGGIKISNRSDQSYDLTVKSTKLVVIK